MAVSSFFVPCLFLERQHRIITFVSVELEASIEGLQGPIIVKFKNRSKNKTPRSDFWSGTRDSGFQFSLRRNLLSSRTIHIGCIFWSSWKDHPVTWQIWPVKGLITLTQGCMAPAHFWVLNKIEGWNFYRMINFRLNFWERRLHLKLQNRKYTPRKTLVDGRDEVRDSCQKPSRPPTTPGPSEHMGAAGICFCNTYIKPIPIRAGKLP